jgi:putative transposase
MYHIVLPAKYRHLIFDDDVDEVLKDVCLDIENRYQIKFLEIGPDKDHVHFFVQSELTYCVTKIVTMIKSISGRKVFRRSPKVKKLLWGGEMWTGGYYAGTVGKHGNEDMIGKYVKGLGCTYQKLYSDYQLSLF